MSALVVTLAELALPEGGSFVDGPFGSDLKASDYVPAGVPVMRIQNVRPNAYSSSELRYISAEKAASLARHDYRPGDVVITKLGDPCGVACEVPEVAGQGIIVADVVRFRGRRDAIDHRYLVHFLNSPSARRQVAGLAKGTTRQRVNLSDLRQVRVPLLPIAEQRRIVAILDEAEAIRRKHRESLRLLDEFLRSAYEHIADAANPARDDWPEHRVADLAAPGPGSLRTGPFGSALRHSEFVSSGVAVLGIDNAVQNHFAWAERRYITAEKYKNLKRYTIRPGDVIVTIMGTTGRSAVVPDDIPLAITTKHLAAITVDQAKVVPEFLSHVFHSDRSVLAQIASANRGAIMAGLNLGIIKRLRLRVPPLSIQYRFAQIVGRVRETTDRAYSAGCDADALFESLARQAFPGQ